MKSYTKTPAESFATRIVEGAVAATAPVDPSGVRLDLPNFSKADRLLFARQVVALESIAESLHAIAMSGK